MKKTSPQTALKSSSKKSSAKGSALPLQENDFSISIKNRFKGLMSKPMPQDLKPMLAGVTAEAFDDENWQFELKWDGYRALSYLNGSNVELRSRNNLSFDKKYKEITVALQQWNMHAVIDGEIVVLNEEGHPDFEALQKWILAPNGNLVYFVFDVIWLDGYDLMQQPLGERREILKAIMPDCSIIRYSDSIDHTGIDFFQIAKKNALEGIIAKKKDSVYTPGYRTKWWLKIKIEARHEAVVCGYTKNRDSDRLFSSLVLGVQDEGKVKFIGQVGTGFNQISQKEIFTKLTPLVITDCPFDKVPKTGVPTVWVKPYYICEVKYTELTAEGLMRHPSFQGLRPDKFITDFNEGEVDYRIKEKKKKSIAPVSLKTVTETTDSKKTLKSKIEEKESLVDLTNTDQVVTVDKQLLKISNLQKIYWPKEKIRKGDLINYYHLMAPYIFPYMKDRPLSLNRHPNGINGESFYQKNMQGKAEPWIKLHRRFSESNGEIKDFMVCTNEASLLYMANLGCIEMNPWHSRTQNPEHPDWSVIDLDPGDISFEKVIETAQVVKKVLDTYKIPSFVKTSGSSGIHIYVPFGAKYDYDQSKQFAELIAHIVHEELPLFTSLERNPQKRKDKIYIDYLQNRPIQTICAPYSARPKPGATVSTPLHWDEVKQGLDMHDFTIHNIYERVQAEGDLFTGVLGKGIDLKKVIGQLAGLM